LFGPWLGEAAIFPQAGAPARSGTWIPIPTGRY